MDLENQRLCEFGPFQLDRQKQLLLCNGALVPLGPKGLHILTLLVEARGDMVTRQTFMEQVWAGETVEDGSLNRQIYELRQLLSKASGGKEFIETVPRRGYRLVAGGPSTLDRSPSSETSSSTSEREQKNEPPAREASVPREAHVTRTGAFATVGRWNPWLWFVGLFVGVSVSAIVFAIASSSSRRDVPIVQHPSVELAQFPDREVAPTFSPDGEDLAFHSSDGTQPNNNIYRKPSAGGPGIRLTTGSDDDRNPAWSPDGRLIAFIRNTGPHGAVYLMTPQGGQLRKLTDTTGWGLSWYPTSQYLAITDCLNDFQCGIVLVEAATGRRHPLLPSSVKAGDNQVVKFSPDGQHLAFLADHGQLWISDIKTQGSKLVAGEIRQLTKGNREWECYGLAWMPNSRELVFAADRGTGPNLWLISATPGSQPQALQFAGQYIQLPAVSCSPPGKPIRLAYEKFVRRVNLWRFEVSDDRHVIGTPFRIAPSRKAEAAAQFSPDKKQIAFASVRESRFKIYVANADGSNVRELPTPGEGAGSPRWSPDGRRIAFDAIADGNHDIYVSALDNPSSQRLTTGPFEKARPSWSRDGRWIYFGLNHGSKGFDIWKVRSDGAGEMRRVTRHGGFEAFESWDGTLLYYVKSRETPGLWKVPLNGGDEAPVIDSVLEGQWAVTQDGIYFMYSGGGDTLRDIEFFPFAKPRIEFIYRTHGDATKLAPGFAASRDGRLILIPLIENQSSEITVVHNFDPKVLLQRTN